MPELAPGRYPEKPYIRWGEIYFACKGRATVRAIAAAHGEQRGQQTDARHTDSSLLRSPGGTPFRPDRIIPSFGDTALMLAPAMLVSIYGNDLGPAEGCRGYGDQRRWETLPADNPFHVWERIVIYPTQLCNVRVTIGDIPAGLLWVQTGQINFQVPKEVPFGGSANLRVIHAGVASDPAPLRFGLERMAITQDEPAYAGMPVWVRVHTANDLQDPLQYPLHDDPLWLPCEDVEVRRNGVPLPRQAARNGMMTRIPNMSQLGANVYSPIPNYTGQVSATGYFASGCHPGLGVLQRHRPFRRHRDDARPAPDEHRLQLGPHADERQRTVSTEPAHDL